MVQIDEGRRVPVGPPPVEPLIERVHVDCTECWSCVRHCPARALRVVGGHTEVIEERCVKCGACVAECSASGHRIRSDLERVRGLLSSGAPVVAMLASEYVAAMHPMTPADVERAIESAGFMAMETTVLGEEIVAAAYEQLAPVDNVWPRLRSTCPVAVDWVRKFHPHLTEALVPIVPPYVAQARLVHRIYPDNVAIVYVSPCWSRKDEVYAPEYLGEIEVAIGFDELKTLLADVEAGACSARMPRRPQAAKQLSATDGFPRRTLERADCTDGQVFTVRGLPEIDRVLTAITRGEICPGIVDMLACDGCIDGPCVNPDLSVFAKRNIDIRERERQGAPAVDSRTFLSAIPTVPLRRTHRSSPAIARIPTDAEIDAVLREGDFNTRDELVDCGACGYNTCVEHAAAICLGNSNWDMCFPLMKKRLLAERERFAREASTDNLTGLHNRRSFDERIAEEVARAGRYGTALSVVMLDLDSFKDVNDRHGHAAGDALLRAVGILLKSELRTTDIAVRYGGDEFALILPNTPKTDAWAVAEKVRASLRTLAADAGGGSFIGSTASMGIASFCEEYNEAAALIQAADAALYRAKRAGRDRVEIAAG